MKFIFIAASAILAVCLYFAVDQIRFELRLRGLQSFCNELKIGSQLDEIERKLQEDGRFRMSSAQHDQKTYADLSVDDEGWVCSLAFEKNQLTIASFGSDHGARTSLLQK